MLSYLSISDFAIIDQLRVEFTQGFNVLTGETGAGKSILVQALHLLLGGRAYAGMIRTDRDSAEVEGLFQLPKQHKIIKRLEKLEFDDEDNLAIRRIVTHLGKNKVFINGHMATLSMLSELASGLVDISGQHEHIGLTNEDTHRDVLDEFGRLHAKRDEVKAAVLSLRAIETKQQELVNRERQRAEREEYLQFSIEQIDQLAPLAGEDIELQSERLRLANIEKLILGVQMVYQSLYENDGAVVESIGKQVQVLSNLSRYDNYLMSINNRLDIVLEQIGDVAQDLRSLLGGLELDPGRLEEVEQRLTALQTLMRKHDCSLDEVIKKREDFQKELDEIAELSSRQAEIEKEREQAFQEAMSLATRLSELRLKEAKKFSAKIEKELKQLAMGDARVRIEVTSEDGDGLQEWGLDKVRILFSANRGEKEKPLVKIASGGELSRFLLALKAVLLDVDGVPTYVFDEVDSGVGGAVAEVIGSKLAKVSSDHQVICITHLPQIAAFGKSHFVVKKHVVEERTVSEICLLNEREREEEVARMAGGTTISEEVIGHARDLIRRARSG
jgi:DNA repair protein RecN (Recombination protein N)